MPIEAWVQHLFTDRAEFNNSLSREEVQSLIANQDLKVLQCSNPVDTHTWKLLNDEFFTRRPEVQLRVYGFYTSACDLAFVSRMTNIHHFSADNLMDATGVEHVAAMENLESLGIGIYHLEGFEFLNQVTPKLWKLFLGRTQSNKPDLLPLNRFASLKDIYLEGHQKNIEVLSDLEKLEDVTLRSISTPDISYLTPLHRMWSLDIKLGGIKNLDAIQDMENIKYLELWQIKGLADIRVISSLTGLQYLFLQSLRQVTIVPALNHLAKLRRIFLVNMKGLKDIRSLASAPALEDFIHETARNMEPEDYLPLLNNRSLKRVYVNFSNGKKYNRLNELLRERDLEISPRWTEFEFV